MPELPTYLVSYEAHHRSYRFAVCLRTVPFLSAIRLRIAFYEVRDSIPLLGSSVRRFVPEERVKLRRPLQRSPLSVVVKKVRKLARKDVLENT